MNKLFTMNKLILAVVLLLLLPIANPTSVVGMQNSPFTSGSGTDESISTASLASDILIIES
ncbi:MAG: hypothetical protein GPJ54_12495 [Candidatus Heimdallarchaeota archaeon]|nr:hypothetical protein [Candidatus Heimdallarchaeota archaeon]